MSEAWVALAAVDLLPPGAVVTGQVAPATEVAVFNVDGELCAIDGTCPHRGGPLAEGIVRDGVVTCPLHWARFDLRTGRHVSGPGLRLACFPVRVIDGVVEVLVPSAPEPRASLRERLLAAGREWTAEGGGRR